MNVNDGYPVSVPVMNRIVTEKTRDATLRQLRDSDAKRVWLALSRDLLFPGDDEKSILTPLKENIRFFSENGLEVGVWVNAYGFGGPLPADIAEKTKSWSVITAATEEKSRQGVDMFCPSDPDFTAAFCEMIRKIAALKPDLIMLDDDLCLSVRPGLGCFCDRHMALLSEKLKQPVSRQMFVKQAFTRGRNAFREAWRSVMRHTHIDFCTAVRQALDSVDSSIRLGFCAGYTSWDIEGADALELTKILAGDTKPFLRLTSAPYWVTKERNRFPGMKLNTVIEFARQQVQWCEGTEVEIFNENDSYPRPRYHTPASYCECFDIAMRATGGAGTLKYSVDYNSSPAYEPGYVKAHLRHEPMYRFIDTHFADKTAQGVHIYRPMRYICHACLPEQFPAEVRGVEKDIMRRAIPPEPAMLTQLGIPVCYADTDKKHRFGAAFGDDVLFIPESGFPEKLIVDVTGALYLQAQGRDLGLVSAGQTDGADQEQYVLPGTEPETVGIYSARMGRRDGLGSGFYEITVKPEAQVQSWYITENGKIPASYTYRSGDTEYLVLAMDADTLGQSCSCCTSYGRQKQIMDFLDNTYPEIRKEPGIYTLYKYSEREKTAAVLFQNLGEDPLFNFDIFLGSPCKTCECFGADAVLSEDRTVLHITSDVPPRESLALLLTYSEQKTV